MKEHLLKEKDIVEKIKEISPTPRRRRALR